MSKFSFSIIILFMAATFAMPQPASAQAEVVSFNLSSSTIAYQGNTVPGYETIELKTSVPTRGYILVVGSGIQTKINLSTMEYKMAHKVDWVPWDDTKKAPLPAGEYQLKAYLTDEEFNQMSGYPLGKFRVVTESSPKPLIDQVSVDPAVFAPKYGQSSQVVQVPFNLNRPAEVQLSIQKNGVEIFAGSKVKLSAGSQTVSWNGTDQTGRIVADGAYEVVFKTIETAYNYPATSQRSEKLGTITIKDGDYNIPLWRLKEIVTNASYNTSVLSPDGDGVNDTVTGQFTLAEPVKVSIYIANAAGAHINHVIFEQTYQAGVQTFEWNGTDMMGGKAPNGSYSIKIAVIEGANSGYITFDESLVRIEGSREVKALQPEKRVRVISETAQMTVEPLAQGYKAVKGDTFALLSETIQNGQYQVLVKDGVSGTINVNDVELVSETPAVQNTIDYTVISGDTLWKIAAKFNTTVSKMVTINNLDPNKYLYVGQKLKIPAVKTVEPVQPSTYKVQTGDTLWKIAQKFGTTIAAFVSANGLDPAKYLQVGQTLTIPEKSTTVQPPAAQPIIHTVQSGDTLWKIAQKYSLTVDAIVKANNLDPNKYLVIGQKLTIPR
ncbi:MAG: LysM peptidoglycan-binding domain-containing protein [Bacillota bacterium]